MPLSISKIKQIYLIFCIGILFASCDDNKDIDVSNIPVDVKIERFDRDFDAMSRKPMPQQAYLLQQKYGNFYADYVQQILEVGNVQDTSYFNLLRQIFAAQAYKDLKHDIDAVFPGNMEKQNEELTDAFRRIKYYYPEKKLPKVYAYFSGFKAQTSIGDGYFAIGLDLFLGADSRFYPALRETFPFYLSRRFTPDYIAPRVVEGIAREDMFPENDPDKTLLSKMVYAGKILYFMDKVLPNAADSVKIGYTNKQLDWCKAMESNIWAYFLEENLLYETDYQRLQTYLNEAPFTPGLGEHNDSAPKLGIWTGWQIVRKYMAEHTDVTLQQLMEERDAQKILNEAKYRPK
ncbi:gliding motility lipoprotein GldB [Mucilaginibacter auburnensis]|uniref:Gliding motility-associated lipoprotein GldB n=1 Tax=Mucilaginibacter auburnensis TaxID=1457233 RepID=A0A2H9VN05_9SPHI|nr:gliding motility lipoprotein GldB [Mucilaginibacter auburnensis]PJJ79717.1 gliding motility-associated lipoprotein GldB [Mucilaginibacter auburnensis]